MRIFLEGPDDVKKFGPLEVEWHRYLGPGFFWFGKQFTPRRYNPVWLIARWMYPDKLGRRR